MQMYVHLTFIHLPCSHAENRIFASRHIDIRVGNLFQITVLNVGSAALTNCESFIALRSCEQFAHMDFFYGSLDFLRNFLLCRCDCEFPLCRDEARTMVPINCKASAYRFFAYAWSQSGSHLQIDLMQQSRVIAVSTSRAACSLCIVDQVQHLDE